MNIDKIKNKAKFVLDDDNYNRLVRCLDQNKIDYARLLLDQISEEVEFKLAHSKENDKEELLQELKNLNTIESEIFNLYVEEYEGEQIKYVAK